ncbi:hypothetical protein SAMN05216573_12155 [Bradyrhizobium sp. Rc3b]|nr:hypothetical protein SAMN05216573_12155 [Bradyrhizobium sp. Rc3b]
MASVLPSMRAFRTCRVTKIPARERRGCICVASKAAAGRELRRSKSWLGRPRRAAVKYALRTRAATNQLGLMRQLPVRQVYLTSVLPAKSILASRLWSPPSTRTKMEVSGNVTRRFVGPEKRCPCHAPLTSVACLPSKATTSPSRECRRARGPVDGSPKSARGRLPELMAGLHFVKAHDEVRFARTRGAEARQDDAPSEAAARKLRQLWALTSAA